MAKAHRPGGDRDRIHHAYVPLAPTHSSATLQRSDSDETVKAVEVGDRRPTNRQFRAATFDSFTFPSGAEASTSSPPSLPPSREPSLKRGRAAAPSNISAHAISSRSVSRSQTTRNVLPPIVDPNSHHEPPPGRASGDHPLHSRPSLSRSHTRQISVTPQLPSLSRQASSNSPHTPQTTVQQNTRGFPSQNVQAERKPSLATVAAGNTPSPSGPMRLASIREKKEQLASTPSRRPRTPNQGSVVSINEFGLEHLFQSFREKAHTKIMTCVSSVEREHHNRFNIETECAEGVDTTFDMVITGLGTVVRDQPRPLIERLLLWRSEYSQQRDTAEAGAENANHHHSASAGSSVPSRAPSRMDTPQDSPATGSYPSTERRRDMQHAAATYLIGRVMIAVLSQTTLSALTMENARKLEAIIFDGQIKQVLPEDVSQSPAKKAKWNMMIRLLGVFSEIDLEGISKMFFAEIQYLQGQLGPKTNTDRGAEEILEFRLQSMKYFRLKSDTPEDWRRARDFMSQLTRLFSETHGLPPKREYCRLLEHVLLPFTEHVSTDLPDGVWRNIVNKLQERLLQLSRKPKYSAFAFPAQVVLACCSASDLFAAKWNHLLNIQSLSSRLPKADVVERSLLLKSLCRLTWSFLNRNSAGQEAAKSKDGPVLKNLEEIARSVFFTSKKYAFSTDASVTEPLIFLIRLIGYASAEFAFKSIIFPLINAEALLYNKELKLSDLEPDKVVLGIRGFLAVIGDLETKARPPFPLDFADEHFSNGRRASFQMHPRQPANQQQRRPSLPRAERLSRPVITNQLEDTVRAYYDNFCDVLGIITQMCNGAFGGRPVPDEKFVPTYPRNPLDLARDFARRETTNAGPDQKLVFYDLFHVAVQALPRCRPRHIPIASLIALLCIGTAHVEMNIANSSSESLRSISRQGHAQLVAERFGGYILHYDNQYSTMSDGGLLGQRHIENTLRLYIELLNIWVDELREKFRVATIEKAGDNLPLHRQALLDTSGVWSQVDRLESQGLFFLCSPMPIVRGYAVRVLELVTDLEDALGQHNERIWRTLSGGYDAISIPGDPELSTVEQARLARKNIPQLCCSPDEADKSLWSKLFPCIVRTVFDKTPMAVTPTREDICARLYQLQSMMEAVADDDRQYANATPITFESDSTRFGSLDTRRGNLEQWKFFLMFACTTLNKIEPATESLKSPISDSFKRGRGNSQSSVNGSNHSFNQAPSIMRRAASRANTSFNDENADINGLETSHTRSTSNSSQVSPHETLNNASDLFGKVTPLLYAKNKQLRVAAVAGLGAININLYKPLLETLMRLARFREGDARRYPDSHARTTSTPRKHDGYYLFAVEVVQVYQITSSRFVQPAATGGDPGVLELLSVYTKEIAMWLQRGENSMCGIDLKIQFSGLIEAFYNGIADRDDAMRLMPFQTRKASYVLLDRWWRESSRSIDEARRAHNLPAGVPIPLHRNDANVAKAKELQSLRLAACKAMAALCAGPVKITMNGVSHSSHAFHIPLLLEWVVQMLEQTGERHVEAGRRALRNLLTCNRGNEELLDQSLERLFRLDKSKPLTEFIEVLVEVFIMDRNNLNIPYWRILSVLLLVLGKTERSVRMAAVRLLRAFEGRESHTSQLHQLEISVSDNTTVVYRGAQFEISRRLADRHAPLVYYVFSDLVKQFLNLDSDQQRNLVPVLLPWLQRIELKLSSGGVPTPETYMVLVNLLYITKKCFVVFHTELQALWQALVTGPYEGNLKLIIDYLVDLGAGRQYGNWPGCAKQVVVFLANSTRRQGDQIATNSGTVIEMIISKLIPRAMITPDNKRNTIIQVPDHSNFPYVANLLEIYDVKVGQTNISLGQTCLIYAVDLIVPPVQLAPERIPGLLQILMILWDHHADIVREHAREMLVHLIHELVLSKLDNNQMEQHIPPLEKLIDQVRSNDGAIAWNYEERSHQRSGHELPAAMPGLVRSVISFFSLVYKDIELGWGKAAMEWATQCPVRHLACRSLQVYRCILQPRDFLTLSEFTSRLATTMADEKDDIQAYSMELIRTIRDMVGAEAHFDSRLLPVLFWTTYTGLESVIEWEFLEFLATLEHMCKQLDLSDARLINVLDEARPRELSMEAGSITDLVYKGCRSSGGYESAIRVLDDLVQIPSNAVVGDNTRVLFCFLANLPRFLKHFNDIIKPDAITQAASNLASAARIHNEARLSEVIENFMKGSFRDADEFLQKAVSRIGELSFFVAKELDVLKFVMGMLSNNTHWVKVGNLRVLKFLMPAIDMSKPEIANQGPDLVSPLLRLLQTELCPEALKVLDNVMPLKGTPLGHKHLEMSMADNRSSEATRREYEATESFYGIPEASGWSIPMPAAARARARRNLDRLKDLGTASIPGETTTPTPEVQFYQEQNVPGSYFPETDNYGHAGYDTTQAAGTMEVSIMADTYDELEDFFAVEPVAGSGNFGEDAYLHCVESFPSTLGAEPGLSTPTVSSRRLEHDPDATPPSHETMRRVGIGGRVPDLRTTPPREPEMMSPSAFGMNASPISALPPRPMLSGRSMTSPAVRQIPEEEITHVPTPSDVETYSEDDTLGGRVSTSDRSFVGEQTTTRARSGSKSSIRSGVRSLSRRLTASGRRAAQLEQSPVVPKVPDRYFHNTPQSSEP